MNIFVRFISVLFLFNFLISGHDLPLYSIIQSNLSKYRQSISSNDFSFQNSIIHIELDGRRTNIKSQMLLGFYSAGLALNRIDIHYQEIEIVIHYNVKTGGQVSARASAKDVMSLSQGRLSSEKFFILMEPTYSSSHILQFLQGKPLQQQQHLQHHLGVQQLVGPGLKYTK